MAAIVTTSASTSETPTFSQDSSNVNDPLFLHHGENLVLLSFLNLSLVEKVILLGLDQLGSSSLLIS